MCLLHPIPSERIQIQGQVEPAKRNSESWSEALAAKLRNPSSSYSPTPDRVTTISPREDWAEKSDASEVMSSARQDFEFLFERPMPAHARKVHMPILQARPP